WDDATDLVRIGGSLLPLWKLRWDISRQLLVSTVCWSPVYPDILAAAYTIQDDLGGNRGPGLVCLYTLKNVLCPAWSIRTPTGASSLNLHPTKGNILAVGCMDGTIMVYDVSKSPPTEQRQIKTTIYNRKHIM
ncbi:unnamed protein product, partial [Meganyctiphanes norvegica]